MRVLAYCRVSTDEQASRGASIEVQRARIAGYCELYDLTVAEWIEDAGVSGRTIDRPGLNRALAMLRAGEVGGLVVMKLDRLTRSVADLGRLIEGPFKRAALFSVGEQIDCRSAGGRMVLNVLASVSQWEREIIAERVTTALAHLKALGRQVGAVPYGQRAVLRDGKRCLEIEPAEQAAIELARELAAAGMKPKAIGLELARRGHLSRTGKPLVSQQVIRLLAA